MGMTVLKDNIRSLRSDGYNYDFNTKTGYFERWAYDKNEPLSQNPKRSKYGPEILDCEIVVGCKGVRGHLCQFCYKANTANHVEYMPLEKFQKVFDKINKNKTITQVALGLDAGAELNPDTWKISEWLRKERNVVPNGTVADITPETADKIAALWGGCAVSAYISTPLGMEAFHDSVELLTDRIRKGNNTLNAVNCHFMISEETFELCKELLMKTTTDRVLNRIGAIVLLSLKKCGRGKTGFNCLSQEKFNELVSIATLLRRGIGFDSCAARKFESYLNSTKAKLLENATEDKISSINQWYDQRAEVIEPCESFATFSSYINVRGEYFPCSFCEGHSSWNGKGIDVLKTNDFIEEVWNSPKMLSLHEASVANNRKCLYYEV